MSSSTPAASDVNWYDLTCTRNYDAIRAAVTASGPPPPEEMFSCIQCALAVNASGAADIVKSARFFFSLVDSCGNEYAMKVAKLVSAKLKQWAKQGLRDYDDSPEAKEFETIVAAWTVQYEQ